MPNPSDTAAPPLGLRERKKQKTRAAIVEAATRLFEQRGFDHVTVAEVAAAADVSAKTLFTYFASKEDLLFGDETELQEMILAAIRDRAPGESVLGAVRRQIEALVSPRQAPSLVSGLDGLRRSLGDNAALHARLRLMWERYEIAIAAALMQETDAAADDPRPRMVAAQIVALYRLLISDAVGGALLARAPGTRPVAVRRWFEGALDLIEQGTGSYGRKGKRPKT
ncbi:TetR/AcrR family transcriptional regulator [Bradyrhizobium prioriisuperbiae]|uniref:TetR/AcrR family transcriptional regulator n=1 Tax=Bradyrhizobium prioriisuperbiae TaxID=2854389 RepID=UPI0028E2A303|nr:TetR/AcrR family transcriptional regulator [Bradyrhizobium prioritasuperba]